MTKQRQLKDQLYALFARVANAMANPHRLELLDLLVQGPRTVQELANEAHMTIANTSQHLQRLKQARLVKDTREGLYIRYALSDPAIASLWLQLRSVAQTQLVEVEHTLDAYRNHRHEFETISANELRARMQRNEVVLLDVRPRPEYLAAHLPRAVSMPLDELDRRLGELPRRKTIVAYCRGPYCVFADEALERLSARGWKVARLEEGVAEWQMVGLPLEA